MAAEPEPSTDVVGYASEEEVRKVVGAIELLETYAKDLPTLTQFKTAAAALVSNLLMDSLTGKYGEPRNIKEAIQVANNVMDLVVKRDASQLQEEINSIDDPEERKAILDEIKAKVREAKAK